MVAAKRKSWDVSLSTNQVKDATTKELGVSSSSGVKDTTPPKIPAAPVSIPEDLYILIKESACIRGSPRTNKKDVNMVNRRLYVIKRKIRSLEIYYKAMEELPSSWEYNDKTEISAYVPKPAKQTKKKTKRTIVKRPTINGALNEEEQKVWTVFETANKTKAHECMRLPMKKIKVAVTEPVVSLILCFAVAAFNDSYQKYVKEHRTENIIKAVPVACEYYKLTSEYRFYLTIEASEQGNAGVYEAAVNCDRITGARTLSQFVFKNPATESVTSNEYEEAWASDSSGPDGFYNTTGMVHRDRQTRGGGFNYHNPSSDLHRYCLNDGRTCNRRGKAAP